jgi:Domain of unknown function (DUF4411)
VLFGPPNPSYPVPSVISGGEAGGGDAASDDRAGVDMDGGRVGSAGDVRSIDVVRDELSKRDDEVHAWARTQEALFLPLDEAVQRATREVLAAHPKLMGRGGGRNAADPFVIGLALARGGVVVTEETMSGNLDNKPRIPDVCQALGVPWTNLVGFLQQQGYSY